MFKSSNYVSPQLDDSSMRSITPIQVMPINKVKPVLQHANAVTDLNITPTNDKNNEIYNLYKTTPAYDIKNSISRTKFSKENSLINRFYRFYDEPIVVVEQSNYEKINTLFTGILFIFTIILMLYEYKNDLHLVQINHDNNILIECEMINKMTDAEKEEKLKSDKKTQDYYNNIKLASNILKGISIFYIVGLGARRIYKRTTI